MSDVPSLAYNPGITAADIPTPWVLLAQGQTKYDVEYGSLYSVIGETVQEILAPGPGATGTSEPVRFYVIRGPESKWGVDTQDGGTWVRATKEELADINDVRKGPYPVWDYVIALPDVDARLPYKIRFKKSGTDAAKEINFHLLFAGPGNESTVGFELRTEKIVGDFKYVVPRVKMIEVPALEASKDAEVLEGLRRLAAAPEPTPQIAAPAVDAPALD